MNTKRHLLLITSLLIANTLTFAGIDIPINAEDDIPAGTKSLQYVPSASLDGTELTLSYPLSTESQVIIIDQRTQSTVYTETFAATRSLNIDLEEEGLPDGSYTLRIYAFGKWWIGEFVLGEDE